MISRQMMFSPTLLTVACAALLLAACDSANIDLTGDDSTTPDLTGGAAGDEDSSPEAITLLAPFAGIYDLQDDWNGQIGDEAFLVIEIPGSDGIAPAALYDFDDFSNCVPQRPSTGEVSKDLFSDRVFMDGILQFDEAELSLSGSSTLTIEFNDDADIDNDGSTLDRVSITAQKLGIILVLDLGDTCT